MVNNYVKAVQYNSAGRIVSHNVYAFDDTDGGAYAAVGGFAVAAPSDARVSVFRPFAGLPVIGESPAADEGLS